MVPVELRDATLKDILALLWKITPATAAQDFHSMSRTNSIPTALFNTSNNDNPSHGNENYNVQSDQISETSMPSIECIVPHKLNTPPTPQGSEPPCDIQPSQENPSSRVNRGPELHNETYHSCPPFSSPSPPFTPVPSLLESTSNDTKQMDNVEFTTNGDYLPFPDDQIPAESCVRYDTNDFDVSQYNPLLAPAEVDVNQSNLKPAAEMCYVYDQSAYQQHLLQPQPPLRIEESVETVESTHIDDDPIHLHAASDHPGSHTGRSVVAEEGCDTVFGNGKVVELKVEENFLRKSNPNDPLLFYHSRHYLEDITVNQLIDIRFVFSAHQLPRGSEFANLVGPIRKKHKVDTYLIPHESTWVYENQDVVFSVSGTLDRVRAAVYDFLLNIVPRSHNFRIWRFCLLVPRIIIQSLTGSRETVIADYAPDIAVESCVPALKKAMARVYGPIRGAKQEHLLSIESCSFTNIIGAVVYVAKMLSDQNVSQDSYQGYYRGGRRSVIPKEMKLSWDRGHSTTLMDAKVPAGYVLRPEIRFNLKEMHKKRYHLQFTMDIEHVENLTGKSGLIVRSRCEKLNVAIYISDELMTSEDKARVCDVGGSDVASVADACKDIVNWIEKMFLGEWLIGIYVPRRVAIKSSEWTSTHFQHSIISLPEAEHRPGHESCRLEPDEEESILRISSQNAEGFQEGVAAVLDAIYDRDTRNSGNIADNLTPQTK
ncbi:hypothetical protein BGX27_005890 [Mortierella sp. AM989]|nr:hypothetical protein BGX27_005890 [Mortierella sp. AM989]